MNISHKKAVDEINQRGSYLARFALPVCAVTRKGHLRRWLSFLILLLPLCLTACGDSAALATVSTEGEAIEILNVLHENALDAHKEEVGEEGIKQWKIALDQSWFGGAAEVALANQVLQDNGLPRPANVGATPASDGAMFKDEATRKAEQLKEREAELQRKLRLLPGVIGVAVSIVEPEDSAININPYPSTASVLIVSKDDPPNFDQATVKGLVARSVPKLNAESVFVAITTKPVRPLPWHDLAVRRRHKILDAAGIGILIILASSIVVLLLQMRRQSSELASLRERQKPEQSLGDGDSDTTDLALTEANERNENRGRDPQTRARAPNAGVAPTAN